jgi:stage IV sporulation protein B
MKGVDELNRLSLSRSRFFFIALFTLYFTVYASAPGVVSNAFAQLPDIELRADQVKLIPGGQTVGVKLNTIGALVVGHHAIQSQQFKKISPAEIAKVQMGDVILSVNHQKVKSAKHFAELIQQFSATSDKLELEIQRADQKIFTHIKPIFDTQAQKYRLGIYVRDSAAGIGTMTFYSNLYKVYGALGHMITDADSQAPLLVKNGEILPAEVTSIKKGEKGAPGEKRAQIITHQPPIGNIEKNTDFGIFGELAVPPQKGLIQQPLSIATRDEIKEGPAKILTVVEGQKVDSFAIEIMHLNSQESPETRSMVLRITDPRLLAKTGGIIQGMSGSPIIQNGKIIGAVTHVFVNDPTSGYGCYIEWMLRDAGLKIKAA